MRKAFIVILFLFLSLCSQDLFGQRRATILDHKDRIRITRLNAINSRYRETNLSITPDGKYLFFMSLRGGQPWSNSFMQFKGDSVFDGDIWYSRRVNSRWTTPICMPYGINTMQGEDEPNVSPDGRRVYFQSWNRFWGQTGGPYYMASRKNDTWSRPQGLGGGITEFFLSPNFQATDGMGISPDEKTLIVAAGKDYDGNMDIYMSRKSSFGWSYCKRLSISTAYDDRSVFLAADGKTLYFASNGYKGYGGLDIFKTTLNPDGSFGEVINVGKPFNTAGDDYGLILTADGMEAYFVRNGDIYYADLREADPRIRPASSTVQVTHTIKGTVRDSLSWRGMKAEVLVLDARTKIPVKKIQTPANGKYSFSIPNKNGVYDEFVIAEGYQKKRRRIKVQPANYSQTINVNFLLSKVGSNMPPPIVHEEKPEPPKVDPEPEAAKPDPKPEVPTVSKMDDPKPEKETEVTVEQDPPPALLPEPDPYDFTDIARNNLILLLDVSASMKRSDKLPLLKESFKKLLDHMRPEDRISVVAYSNDARIVVDGLSAAQKTSIIESIERLGGSGGTKGKTALKKAYKLAQENYISGGNNRIILATDGYFDIATLYNIANKLSINNIALSVFSFGRLTKERDEALSKLAEMGKGNYANISRGNVDQALLKEAKAVRR